MVHGIGDNTVEPGTSSHSSVFSEKRTNVFTLCAVNAWNELPEDVWAPSLYSFIGLLLFVDDYRV